MALLVFPYSYGALPLQGSGKGLRNRSLSRTRARRKATWRIYVITATPPENHWHGMSDLLRHCFSFESPSVVFLPVAGRRATQPSVWCKLRMARLQWSIVLLVTLSASPKGSASIETLSMISARRHIKKSRSGKAKP
jgi:hypothetical protein